MVQYKEINLIQNMADGNIEKIDIVPKKVNETSSLTQVSEALKETVFNKAFQTSKEALKMLTEEKPKEISNQEYIAAVINIATINPNIEDEEN